MTGLMISLTPPDAERIKPFGTFVTPPLVAGQRAFFSEYLELRKAASAPLLHVNHVMPSILPLQVTGIERHPFAAQTFIPLSVSRYVAMVMPSDEQGDPVLSQAVAFLMPGNVGIIYESGVWHLGATVLDAPGHFAVLMWRGGPGIDDEFMNIKPITLIPATTPNSMERAAE